MRRLALVGILVLVATLALSPARLVLRDGTVVYGRFINGSPQQIVFQDERGIQQRFDINRVESIDFTATDSEANPYRGGNFNTADRGAGYGYGSAYAILPVGTDIAVRTDEAINAQSSVPGRTYRATIDHDVLDDTGRVAIPRGSEAEMVIRSVSTGGLSGGNLVLDLQAVRVNGRRYLVSTTDIEQRNKEGIGANRRTGEYIGGGAVLGTLLGAIAGGGKGAAIGALSGAIGGGAVQVLTRGKEIRVPTETELTFRLDQPLQLYEAR